MSDPDAVARDGLCTGCGGCAAALGPERVAMAMSAEGYLRPVVKRPLGTDKRRVFDQVCAGRTIDGALLPERAGYDPLWGPIAELATGWALDPATRYRGSSGGVISALAIALLEAGEVDGVLATGADPDDPIDNRTTMLGTRKAVLGAAGSRYAPSSPLAGLEAELASGRRFAFVGKPCDVATLRRMARRDDRIDRQVPYMLAFFCAGVPSRRGTVAVLDALGVEEREVVRFQYRGDGWPGLARATTGDGRAPAMDYNGSWGNILNRHLQFRCKICPDGTGEFADLVCADAWYGKDGYPDFAERDGRSLVIARTARGRALLDRARAAGAVATEPLAVAEIERMQPYQAHRKRNLAARWAAVRINRRTAPRYRRMSLLRLALGAAKVEQLRNFYGTLRRTRGSTLA